MTRAGLEPATYGLKVQAVRQGEQESQSGAELNSEAQGVAPRGGKRAHVDSRRTVRRTVNRARTEADSQACYRAPTRVTNRESIDSSRDLPARLAWRLANEDALASVEPLGKNVSRVSPETASVDAESLRRGRARRFRLRSIAQKMSAHKSVQKCGRVRHRHGDVEVRIKSGGNAYFTGLVHCASAWECPVHARHRLRSRGRNQASARPASGGWGFCIHADAYAAA